MDLGNDCFNKLRQTIAIRFNKEFGEIYCAINPYLTRKEVEDLDRRADQIITEQNLDEDILAFLFSTDSKGKISGKTCKKLYKIIEKYNNKQVYSYTHGKESFAYFKEMVLDCAKHNRTLYWR